MSQRWTRTGVLAAALVALVPGLAGAQQEGPSRVGRVVELAGAVQAYDAETRQWTSGAANRPVTSGDRLWVPAEARAEVRVGSTTLRLGGGTELEALRLDDSAVHFQLHRGRVALRVQSREVAPEIEIATAEVRLHPLRGGHFRIDRQEATTFAAAWRGELRVAGESGLTIESGRRAEIWREGRSGALRHTWAAPIDDEFSAWALFLDRNDERETAPRHVSSEMTGVEDLDRHGRWEAHPEYGSVWIPIHVAVGWEPFRHGRWTWLRPWGWTWIDNAAWGFAPFHYGRWARWQGRWCWVPGAVAHRPAFSPAPGWIGHLPRDRHTRPGGGGWSWTPLVPHERDHGRPHLPHPPRLPHGDGPGHPGRVTTLPVAPTDPPAWARPPHERHIPRSPDDRQGRHERHDGRDERDRGERHRPRDDGERHTPPPRAPGMVPPPHATAPMPQRPQAVPPATPPATVVRPPTPAVMPPAAPPQVTPPRERERERDDARARAPESRPGSRDRPQRQ